MNYRSKALFSLLPCLFLISTLCFYHVAHAQNKAEKCTTQNCVTIKEYQEQNAQLRKEINELKDEIADLNYKIAENKEGIYDSAIQTQSTWLAVYGLSLVFGSGFMAWLGWGKINDIKASLKEQNEKYIREYAKKVLDESVSNPKQNTRDELKDLYDRIEKLENDCDSQPGNPPPTISSKRLSAAPKQGMAFPINAGDRND